MTLDTRRPVSRRNVLKRGSALAGATALIGGTQFAGSVSAATDTLTLDVACDGNTWVINRSPGVEPNAPVRRGDPFIVQGRIYPGGTIEQGLTGASQEGSIGQWVCRGWFYYGLDEIAEGAVPHVVTSQLYLFDSFNGLVSDGMEGGIYVVRAVTGGYGKYRGVRGQVAETEVEPNDTTLDLGGGVFAPAHNIRFEFQLEI